MGWRQCSSIHPRWSGAGHVPSWIFRSCQDWIEHRLASPVDWYPLKQGRRSCADDHMRITWKVCILSDSLYQYDDGLDSGTERHSMWTSHVHAPKSTEAMVPICQPCVRHQLITCRISRGKHDHQLMVDLLYSPYIIRKLPFNPVLPTTRGLHSPALIQYNRSRRHKLM